jgi:hypothetical protein
MMHLNTMHHHSSSFSAMTPITNLEDRQCEALSGGWGRSYSKTKIATTSVNQSSGSTNVAVGFLGSATAQSIQGNGALISTFVL